MNEQDAAIYNSEESVNLETLIFSDADDEYATESASALAPMRYDTMQRKVKDLLSDYSTGDLDPRPSFQRGYVWDKARASKLIESILLNVPLPLIYTAEEQDQREVVIDGQQRLLSVFGFIQNKFPRDGSEFKLRGLKFLPELNGKTFDLLPEKERRYIQKYIFQVIRISGDTQPDVKFEIFERLNSGSVTLNAQELRNCVFRGNFNQLLKDLANLSDFRKLLGGASTVRMLDAELVLRFLAFLDKTYLNYPGAMTSFLNEFMNDNRNIDVKKSQHFSDKFRHATSLSYSVFGSHAFKKFTVGKHGSENGSWERAFNRPLYDVVMWGFTRYEKNQIFPHIDAIRDNLIELMTTDPIFVDTITSAVGDRTKTTYRFEAWRDRLKSIVTNEKSQRSFSQIVRKNLFEQDPTCALCKNTIVMFDDSHVDHIVPFSKGGLTKEENAQITHRYCNQSKSASL